VARDIRPIRTFPVSPYLPARLEGIRELAYNLIWSWDTDAQDLFRRMDPDLWRSTDHNPVLILGSIQQDRLDALSRDAGFLAHYDRVRSRLAEYIADRTRWYQRSHPQHTDPVIAYFSAEYGLSECLTIYSGGMGVLSGDHLKSASDLGMPLVGVGLLYQQGYLRQRLNNDGWQQELLRDNDFYNLPITLERRPDGQPVTIQVEYPGRLVTAQVWRVQVGRIRLFLLDTNVPANDRIDQDITDQLYGGDRDMRIRQEILLGIGGWRLLHALGIPVAAYHLNEGHAAFLSLERIAEHIKGGATFRKAVGHVSDTSVFTTHTPVPAGNEEFDPALVDAYLGHYLTRMGVTREIFHDLARVIPGNTGEPFGMTPLALRTSRHCNGVAALHGAVAREMWQPLYPGRKLEAVPIGHVTNGIHLRTWLHPQMGALLDDFLGEGWEERQDDRALWKKIDRIPDAALWELHMALKRELVEACRSMVPAATGRASGRAAAKAVRLDAEALTIGFARRFATYKRAHLVFSDPDRLARLLCSSRRPVQIIFAGKAHPADTGGKEIIRKIVRFSRSPKFRGRVVFLEDYEMAVARSLVAGVDVWLNNPQRPREASGTSGMKPAVHGGLNLSILDGWWPEGFNGRNGWAIGKGEDWNGPRADQRDAAQLYRALEREVIPLYYDRGDDGLPHRWIACMKNAIATIPVFFNTHRQVKEYLARYYVPAMKKMV
jgi:starch phosphorylase